MLPAEQARGETLLTLARARFDPELREIEQEVLRHSCAYEDPPDWTADPTPDADHQEPTRDPATGRPLPGWQGPVLRPTLLRWLLTDPEATALLEPRGLRVWNARLTEPLDLTGCRIPTALELRYCLVEAAMLLANADLSALTIRNASLQEILNAPFLKLHGPLNLDDVTAAETLNFNAATIPGEVRIANTTLTKEGDTLSMAGASITNDLFLLPNLVSAGGLHLKGIHVSGSIYLLGAKLTTTSTALNLDSATVDSTVYLTLHFASAGEIRLLGAHLGRQLRCSGATLTATGDALSCDRATIGNGVFLNEGFASTGTIRLLGAHLGGVLNCKGASFTSTSDVLFCDGATIDGSVFLDENFASAGTIRLSGARLGGQLVCQDASIHALIAEQIDVRGSVLWRNITNSERTSVNLMGATIKAIYDDYASWPANGNLELNGLQIEDLYPIHAYHLHTTGRIAWLNRQPDSDLAEPQPWLHLASHFEAKGHKRAAKRVIYELRKHQSRANWKNSRLKRLGYFWDTCFAHLEQQPFFILIPILLLTALSGSTFHVYRKHFAETSESAYKATHTPAAQAAPAYPRFQPYVYALENVLPVIKLGQDDKWAPDYALDRANTHHRVYWSLMAIRWFLILSGWVMGGILAAAVSARFRA